MKILNAVIVISLFQLNVCYAAQGCSVKFRVDKTSQGYAFSHIASESPDSESNRLMKKIEQCNNERKEYESRTEIMAAQAMGLMQELKQVIAEKDKTIQSLQLESLRKTQPSFESLLKTAEVAEENTNLRESLTKAEDNEFLPWSDNVTLNSRHLWTAGTTVSVAVCTATAFALSQAVTPAPVLTTVAGVTALVTVGGALMAGKEHYVYNKAFKETGLKSIKSPADQRKLLKKMQKCGDEVSVARSVLFPKTEE
jgi:hypothetical protein